MACVVCQHCQIQVKNEELVAREGYSYHTRCHKCYVCSETDLHDAEVFQGVIFCFSCSQRIFKGCSTAKKCKRRSRPTAKTRVRRRDRLSHQDRCKTRSPTNGVLEMTRWGTSTESDSSHRQKKHSKDLSTLFLHSNPGKLDKKVVHDSREIKRDSVEAGMTTEVTEKLLRQMCCPIVNECLYEPRRKSPVKSSPRRKDEIRHNKKICSDLRIAGLGASTEIAHMALRKKSEMPVIIKRAHVNDMRKMGFTSSSELNEESGDSNIENIGEWVKKKSIRKRSKRKLPSRLLCGMFKTPFRFFKKNVLRRSSVISIIVNCSDDKRRLLRNKLKILFDEEISKHRDRGIRRLYSTINRRRVPYKLGWLNLMAKVSESLESEIRSKLRLQRPKRCRHFRESHSYRCMRAQVMKLAGPTKSELAIVRKKMRKIVAVPPLNKFIMGQNKTLMSQACGNEGSLPEQIREKQNGRRSTCIQ